MMKKILFLAMMAMPLIAACTKEDTTGRERLVGTWHEIAYLCSDGYFVAIDSDTEYRFSEDMTYARTDEFGNESGSYTSEMDQTILTLKSDQGRERRIFVKYHEDGKTAEFTERGSTSKFTKQ